MRISHSDVAGDQTPRSRHGGSRRGLPSTVRPGGQHDTLLHGQTQEIVSHVQELRYHQYLEFPIDLRRDHRLRSITPRPRESSISAARSGNENLFEIVGIGRSPRRSFLGGSCRFRSRPHPHVFVKKVKQPRGKGKFVEKDQKRNATVTLLIIIEH